MFFRPRTAIRIKMPKMFLFRFNIFVLVYIILIIFNENECEQNLTMKRENVAEMKQLISAKCSTKYTSNCFLLDVCKVIDKFTSGSSTYRILPGVYVVRNRINDTNQEMPVDIFEEAVMSNYSTDLDAYVHKKLNSLMDSISLTLKIMDRNATFSVRKLSDDIITELLPVTAAGRGKKKHSKDGAIWAAGALAALGTSALFALTGKAAITSLVALMLSMMCYFKGHGSSHYTQGAAVVAAPAYRHQCADAIIDVNGRGEHATAVVGYKKRTSEDTWNYPRYAPTVNEPLPHTEPPVVYHTHDTYSPPYTNK